MTKGWTGKRLYIDLRRQKAWSENISQTDLQQWIGGRGLNAIYFTQHFSTPVPPSSSENPIAFAAGPVSGTLAPCSGWTSIASFSPLSKPTAYGFTRMPGYFGASIKGSGYDQIILQGKADRPIYLWIDDGKVKFENADHLWGRETTETTVAIQEEKEDRGIEVLCIGPAGEKQIPLANVIHRLSWTGDFLGLGYLLGAKKVKAIAIRGKKEISLYDPKQFLNLCLTLKDHIQKDQKMQKMKEGGKFSFLSREGERMLKDGEGWLLHREAMQWSTQLRTYLSSKEGCFSCPVHCGRNLQHQEGTMGGIHLEKAWYFGPQIGIYNGEWTLKLHRLCQSQGLDPYLTSSLLVRIMDGRESNFLSKEDQRQIEGIEDRGEKAFFILHRMLEDWKGSYLPSPPPPENQDLDVLADIISFCLIVVKHLNLKTLSNMTDLISAATGLSLSKEELKDRVNRILRLESHLINLLFPKEDHETYLRRKEEPFHESIAHWTAP